VLILQLSKSHCSATTSWFIVELLSTDGLLASSAVQREREMESETAKGACMCRLYGGWRMEDRKKKEDRRKDGRKE